MAKSVVILGCTMQNYPPGRFPTDWTERWGINNCWCEYHEQADDAEKLTRIIAMDDLKRDSHTHPDYVKAITTAGIPVITCTAYDEWPCTQDYPLGAVLPHIGRCRLDNSINYALALAMYEGFDRIGLFGCEFTKIDADWIDRDMSPNPPWFTFYQDDAILHRRGREPGVETLMYLLGICDGRGIDVVVPDGSTIFDQDRPNFFYGYQEQPKLD